MEKYIHQFNLYFGAIGALSWAILAFTGFCTATIGAVMATILLASIFMARNYFNEIKDKKLDNGGEHF